VSVATYRNPVYGRSFPDPFVLKLKGEYWAYGTGPAADGRRFPVLRSPDLVRWQEVGGALAPLPGDILGNILGNKLGNKPCYWAPEVAVHAGRLFLYYSVGDEETMEIRVAEADHPAGPFVDSGRRLTGEPFAIDPHVFTDGDGSRWLFYATDFLEHSHVGTGTVADRLLDPWTLAGRPRPVTLPRHNWQVYDPRRAEKGGVRWHTVEGPFVLRRKGLYYQMFSGGNWQRPGYGVSYAVARRLDGPGEWEQAADGERVLPVLRTRPGEVVGPGHNSVVRGPDNRQLYCVYHHWDLDAGARVMAIDPLDWAGERLLVAGPTTTPQPAPTPATLADRFEAPAAAGLGPTWHCGDGAWSAVGGEARQSAAGAAWATAAAVPACFLAEVTLRAAADGRPGAALHAAPGEELLRVLLAGSGATLRWRGPEGAGEALLPLPPGFDPGVDHLLRVEVDEARAALSLDGLDPLWSGCLAEPPTCFALAAEGPAAFAGFALTVGWEDLFVEEGDPAAFGWRALAGSAGAWSRQGGELAARSPAGEASIVKGPPLDAYELTVSGRLIEAAGPAAGWGVRPASTAGDPGPLLLVQDDPTQPDAWFLVVHAAESGDRRHVGDAGDRGEEGDRRDEQRAFPLPGFDPTHHHQLRLRREDSRLTIRWETLELAEIPVPAGPACPALHIREAAAAFDAVRVTALPATPVRG
jgi:GH43 family beta-xylosidase